jgi:hypothetical protein
MAHNLWCMLLLEFEDLIVHYSETHHISHGVLHISSAVHKHLQFLCSPPSEGKENKNQNNLFRFIIPFLVAH